MKNFVLAGIAGGITDFLLGWVLYGIVFYDFFGGGEPNMAMITGGCFSFGFLMSYILVGLAGISGFGKGAELYFAEIVAEKRLENKDIRLEAAIPCRSRLASLMRNDAARKLLLSCTEIGVYGEKCTPEGWFLSSFTTHWR